jgi:hypothetical protein
MRAVIQHGALLCLFATGAASAAIEVDGKISPGEWDGAQHVTDFRMVMPLSRQPATLPTEAWILSTPEGLAIGFRNTQPASVPRTHQESQRDAGGPVDRVNLYVDFDGDGRAGYNFTVTLADGIIDATIGNENQFNSDWDADWKHAVSEDGDTWSAEMLLPWHIAPMQAAKGDKRTIGISLDRVIGSTAERMAWPAISFVEPRFLTVLEKVQVPQYSQSLLAITPFVVGVYDNAPAGNLAPGESRGQFDGGFDLFWKPNGQFQLSATVNPDFGQVESDQLVVNFSAVETFFSDKRPFFTENQGYFDVFFGSLGNANRLIYTRRVGGPSDCTSPHPVTGETCDPRADGSGDVTAAIKLNGSALGFNYGVFAASEADEWGRDFYALRTTREFGKQGLGAMLTRVERPWRDRTADVLSFDHRWTPKQGLDIRTAFVLSDVDQLGEEIKDSGAQVRVEHELGKGWRQQLFVLHTGGDLQLNDFGFLDRNNFNYARYEIAHRITDLPEASVFNVHQWRYATSVRYNDDGQHLYDAVAINRQSDFKDGGNMFFEVASYSPGYDDLILRGNGNVRIPAKYFAFIERYWSRKATGHWEFYGNARYATEGLRGWDKPSLEFYAEPSYHVNDRLTFFAGMDYKRNPDWLLWQGGNQLGSFDSDLLSLNAGMTWLIDPKQELRIRLETIGLDANLRQAWTVAPNGEPIRTNDPIEDFELRNLGFQVRYRKEIAPLSYLYIAYVRGGSLFGSGYGNDYDAGDAFSRAFDLRDSEQLLVKLSYRFEL